MRFFCLIFFFVCALYAKAQDTLSFNKKYVSKNNVSMELGGVGVFGSLNYERNFYIKDNSFHTLRTGIFFLLGPTTNNEFFLPVSYAYVIGKKKSKFFIGMGVNFIICSTPYPTTFAGRQYIRQHPTQKNSDGQPSIETYQPLINTVLCPMIGYEFISNKAFYLKAFVNGVFYRDKVISYVTLPWTGFTFGYKLNKHK